MAEEKYSMDLRPTEDPGQEKPPVGTDRAARNAAKKGHAPRGAGKRSAGVISVIWDIVFWLFCIALVVGSILFAVSDNPNKSYFSYRTYNVLTSSMTPTVQADGTTPPGGFGKGALLVIRMCRPEEIAVGDIITFNPSPNDTENTRYLTHRVVEIKTEIGGKQGIYFVTKGDRNNSADPPISGNMLIGKKVFSLPVVGGFLQTLREHFALALVCLLCLFAAIFLFRWYFAPAPQTVPKGTPPASTPSPERRFE
jgi:signal peptidase I